MNKFKFIFVIAFVFGAFQLAFSHENHSWEIPPKGMKTIGDSHGDIAVSAKGEVYVSVLGGDKAGIQVYSAEGKYLRNVPNAPVDFHGFIIRQEADGEYIYGAGRLSGDIIKMTLDGEISLKVNCSLIPEKVRRKVTRFTAIDVADNGDLYVIDGYGIDYIHHFDKTGKYLKSFGGRDAPYNFKNAHKVAIDRRFSPARILVCDRANRRIVNLDMQGKIIDEIKDVGRASAVAFYGDYLAVANIDGSINILDKQGKVLKVLGTPRISKAKGTKPNDYPPATWKVGQVSTPHGLIFDANGNLLLTEFNKYGRLLKFNNPLK